MATKKVETAKKAVKEETKKATAAAKKTAEKAEKAVKDTAKKADKAVKDTAKKAENATKEAATKVEKATKEAATKVEKATKTAATKAEKAVKETAKKAPAKKTANKTAPAVYFEFAGKQVNVDDVKKSVEDAYVAAGNKASDIKSVDIYVKAEDSAVYFVINGTDKGKIVL